MITPLSIADNEIRKEIYKAFETLKAPVELLSIVGSWKDTLQDEEILSHLQEWNETGEDTLHKIDADG